MDIFYSSLLTINIICILLMLLSGFKELRSQKYGLISLNLILVVFHWFSWQINASTYLAEALFYSNLQVILSYMAMPILVYSLGHWAKFERTNLLAAIFFSIFLLLIFIGFAEPSLRYSSHVVLEQTLDPFGQPMAILRDLNLHQSLLFHFVYGVFLLVVFYFSFQFYRRQKTLISSALVIFLAAQVGASYLGFLFDSGQLTFYYTGGLPLTFLSLCFSLLIAVMLKEKRLELAVQLDKNHDLEQTFSKLAQSVASSDNNNFYIEMLKTLYELSGCKYVFIGMHSADSKQVATKYVLVDGMLSKNFTYDLKGSPCEGKLGEQLCCYPKNVAKLYPDDVMLSVEGMEFYLGIPFSFDGQAPIGLMVLVHNLPIQPSDKLMSVIKVFSARAGAELRRELAEQRLKTIAYYDYVSGLPNRVSLIDEVNRTYFDCETNNTNALLLILDLDFFGQLNRKLGIEVAEDIMKLIGNRLKHFVSTDVFVARNHGDEFVFIFKNITTEIASMLHVQWNAIFAVVSEPCQIRHHKLVISCSGGAVVFPLQTSQRFNVLSCAENALFEAKKNGRKQCQLFDPSLMESLNYRTFVQEGLQQALLQADEQLHMVYQPKVNAKGVLVGAEALLRWVHPSKGFISPVDFIPIAEKSGLINEIGYWVVETVLKQIKVWQQANISVPKIAINIAAEQLNDQGFIQFVIDKLAELELASHVIEIELTESGFLNDEENTITNMQKLKDRGISIALDDFGTGYSSLSYLQRLPLNVLKIDKSFIDNIFEKKSEELVRSIINIAKAMSLDTVAEGAESVEQVEFLAKMGCDYFQGYYFSKPLSVDDFFAFCQQLID